jgi:hypothetical protein
MSQTTLAQTATLEQVKPELKEEKGMNQIIVVGRELELAVTKMSSSELQSGPDKNFILSFFLQDIETHLNKIPYPPNDYVVGFAEDFRSVETYKAVGVTPPNIKDLAVQHAHFYGVFSVEYMQRNREFYQSEEAFYRHVSDMVYDEIQFTVGHRFGEQKATFRFMPVSDDTLQVVLYGYNMFAEVRSVFVSDDLAERLLPVKDKGAFSMTQLAKLHGAFRELHELFQASPVVYSGRDWAVVK